MRDQPPSNQDGKFGMQPGDVSNFEKSDRTTEGVLSDAEASKLARETWQSSTNWINASRRAAWSNSLRAFNSLHPLSSKYLSGAYQHRSSLYMPKTRTMVRRDEASTASALFSNEDVVSVTAADDDDPKQQASAELLKALLQFRLTKTIPWFLTIVGARQDCDVLGVCAAKAYWKYEERTVRTEKRYSLDDDTQMLATNPDGSLKVDVVEIMEKLVDKPVVDLIAPENIRIDPGADWRDPVGSSPYIIEAVAMYLQDVRDKIEDGEWLDVSESALRASTELDDDVTRRSREQGRVPGKDDDAWKPQSFTTCWVHENIVRWGGEDWHYWTLASDGALLTHPRKLKEVYLHGERPYVLGSVIVEAHKTYPAGKVELTRDLQWASNDDWNLRFDVLKMSLNPRQLVKTGSGVDLGDLRSFIPGKSIMVKDTTDVVWDRPPSPGAEAYGEADRINLAFDDLTGSFSNSSVQASQITQQSATGMHLMSGEASGVTEYELRVFAETFVEPLLGLLIKLEQAYETDPVILSLCGKKAALFEKFGVNGITDELLNQEVTTKVNVGIGATNPEMKMRNFAMAGEMLGKVFGPSLVMGLNFEEVCKEVFGLAGYKDGSRFFQQNFDPRVAALQQQLSKAGGGKQPDPSKVEAAKIQTDGKMQEAKLKGEIDEKLALIELQGQRENDQSENFRSMLKAQQAAQATQARDAMRAGLGRQPHPALAGLMG